LLSSNISSRCPHNMENFGPLTAEIGSGAWGTPANFNSFRVWLRYCSDITHWRPTILCTPFGRLLGWYTIYTFWGLLPPDGILPGAKFTLLPKYCVLLYWQRYCTALEQRPSAKIFGVLQGMELRNFRRGRHLYSAGRPSRWASARILVVFGSVRYTKLASRQLFGRV